jgi:hypothetical protein
MDMNRLICFLVIALFAILVAGCSRARLTPGAPVRDGFEQPTLSNLWETDKIVSSDAKIQSAIVRSGRSALQITLHTSDVFEAGRNGNQDSERAELTEADRLISHQGESYTYSFSMLIPPDFPIVDKRLVIAQWKQECPGGHKCDDNSPVLAIRYTAGILSVTQTIGAHRSTLWQTNGKVRNKWLDFRFRVCFSTDAEGHVTGYLNDSLIVQYSGPTAYQENDSTGYPSPSRIYFKMGLYRDTMTEPMTIFIDDYSKELLGVEKPNVH